MTGGEKCTAISSDALTCCRMDPREPVDRGDMIRVQSMLATEHPHQRIPSIPCLRWCPDHALAPAAPRGYGTPYRHDRTPDLPARP